MGRWRLRPVARATRCLVGHILLDSGVGAAGLISLLDRIVTKITGSRGAKGGLGVDSDEFQFLRKTLG